MQEFLQNERELKSTKSSKTFSFADAEININSDDFSSELKTFLR